MERSLFPIILWNHFAEAEFQVDMVHKGRLFLGTAQTLRRSPSIK